MDPDDVIIADIGGQALDIFLHGPESAHKNGVVKTFTHTSIPIHPCTLIKKKEEKKKKKKSKMLNSPNMMLSFSGPLLSSVVKSDAQEDWHLLLRTAPRLRPSCLGQY